MTHKTMINIRLLILVVLSIIVLNVGLGTALQSTMTLNNGTIISYVYGDEIDDGSAIDFAVNSVNLASEEYILHSVYSSVPPTIDGSLSLNEWGEPAIVDTLIYTNDSVNYETHDMFVYFMNDNNYLYIAVKITNDDYESDLNGDWDTFEIWFDGNNNGIIEPGEDIKQFSNLLYEDWFYEGYFDDYHAWSSDASLDGEGVASHSNQAIGDYTYEFKIPLNSGDAQDLAITSDSTIGLHIKYSEYYYDSIDESWICDGTEDGWPNNGDQFNGSNYGTLKLNSSFTQPGHMEELVSITGQQTTPIVWNASNFDGFKYNSSNIQSTETLTIAPFTLHGPDFDRVIEAGNLTYTTSFVLNKYPIFKDLGLYVNNIDEGYSIGYLNGEQYVAINNADKLAKPLVEFDSNDVKTLKIGDVWNIGGGFSITVLQVDIEGNKVWLQLDKDGVFLDDEVLDTGSNLQSRIWTYDEDVAREYDIPILSLYVSGIMQGEDTDYVQIKYLSLIDNDVSEILSDDIFGNMEVIFMTGDSLGFSNLIDLDLTSSNNPSMIMENISFITLDNLSSIEFYPSMVRNEMHTLSGGGGFVSGNYSSLWNLSEGYTIALQEVDIEGDKAMFSLLHDGIIVDQKIMTERSIAPDVLDSNYHYIKNGTQIINATLGFVFHGSNSEVANLINVYQWSEVDSSILLSNESHIFKSTTSTGMPWNLSEGYTLTMKDVSLDADEVWFELSKNDVVVKDDILDEDTLNISIYTSGTGNISYVLDSVFGGTNESVVKISNVIQYSDISGELLINNSTHLYKTGNPDGIPWILPDGYLLSMKGIDEDSENVWFELFKDGNSLKEDIVRSNAHFTYVNGLESFNCLVSGVMHGTLTDATKITDVNLYSDAGVQLIHNGSRMYTTSNPSGEIWQLFEGYSLDPKDVGVDSRKVWLSLSKDDTVVMDEIIDSWDTNAVRWFNYYNSSGELVFSTYVDGVFKGQVDHLVVLESSTQYSEINGTVLLSIPQTTLRTGITLNDNENSPPVANNDTTTTSEDTSVDITLSAIDVDGDSLTYSIVDAASNGNVTLTGNNATYTPNANFSGTDSFTFKANDGTVDSNTATVSITVTAANVAPTVTILSPPAITNDSTPLLHATFDQIAAYVWYTIDGAAGTRESNADNLTVILPKLENGQHTVKVYSNNTDGNVGNATKDFLVDTIAPALTINQVTSPTNDSSQTITGTFNKSGSGIDSITVNGVAASISDANYSAIIGLTEGINLVDVIAVDIAGNIGLNSTTIVLDTIAPALTINQVTSPTNDSSQIIAGTFNESGSGIDSITVNGVMATISDANYSVIIGLTEGINLVDVIAVDNADNSGSNSTTIVLDTIAPALTINQVTSPTNDSSQIIAGTFNESDSGIDTITVDGVAASISGANYSAIIGLTEGTNSVDVIAVDIAGNIGLNSTTIVLDTIAPALTIDQLTSPTNDVSKIIIGTFNEFGSGIDSITVNGVMPTISGVNYSAIINLTEGTNSVDVIAVDNAGNSGSNSTAIVLDTIVPTANITAPENNTEIKYFENIIKGNVFDKHFDSAVLAVSSESDVLTYDLTITDNSFAQRVEFTPNHNNTLELFVFDTAGNSNNDTMLVFVQSNTMQADYNVSNNASTIIDAMNETDTMIEFHSNVTESNVTFTVIAITDQKLVDEINSSASVFGEVAMGKIVEINVTGLDATNESQVKYVRIELCYTIDDLDLDGDGTVESGELDEDNLFIYWHNESGNWTKLLKDDPEWVLDNGQVKISENNPVGYVWVDVKHLSMFGLAAGSVHESTDDDDDGNDGYVPPGSGGSSGGGSGSSGEAYGNIAVKEVIRNYISVQSTNTYQFKGDTSAIDFVIFDAKTNAGYIAATVEVLRNTSTLVLAAPSGKVYQNMNIWVGTSAYATENNIANPIIGFKVAKSWVTENDIDESTIKLNRHSSGVWDQLPTTKTDEDGSHIYFSSETPGFSPFAITGDERSSTAVADTDGPLFAPPSSIADDDVGEPVGETASVPYDGAKSSSAFVLVIGLILIFVLGVGVYLRKNKR